LAADEVFVAFELFVIERLSRQGDMLRAKPAGTKLENK